MTYELMMRELNLFSLLKRRLRQRFIALFSYTMKRFKGERATLLGGTQWEDERHLIQFLAKNIVIIHQEKAFRSESGSAV